MHNRKFLNNNSQCDQNLKGSDKWSDNTSEFKYKGEIFESICKKWI